MSRYAYILTILLSGWSWYGLLAQENCRVLKPELSGTYTGKCKNGLAQGKGKAVGQDTYEGQFSKGLPDGTGTYTWANGDTYVGEWQQGLRDGEGTMSFDLNGKDTLLAGMWKNDAYIGPVAPRPRVMSCVSIDRYTFEKTEGLKNRVLFDFYQNGARNLGIQNLLLATNSGSDTRLGQSVGYENIEFPVMIKVTYTTWNKLRTAQVNCIFEFEIYEPGDWVVSLHN